MKPTTPDSRRPGRRITERGAIDRVAKEAESVAVLGMRSERHADRPAHYVAARLQSLGVRIVPVPVHEPEVDEMLGEPVRRNLTEAGAVDIVCVFRRSEDVPAHLDDLIALGPPVVWLQSGIRNEQVADALVAAGIDVVQSECLMVRRMA